MKENKTSRKYRPAKEYADLKHRAAVLYIKHGLSGKEIGGKLSLPPATISYWKKAGRWDELRPDLEIINQYKASAMFLQKGMSIKDISINLGVPETIVNIWADLLGWNTTRILTETQNIAKEILNGFCDSLSGFLPDKSTAIEFVKTDYLKSIKPKI